MRSARRGVARYADEAAGLGQQVNRGRLARYGDEAAGLGQVNRNVLLFEGLGRKTDDLATVGRKATKADPEAFDVFLDPISRPKGVRATARVPSVSAAKQVQVISKALPPPSAVRPVKPKTVSRVRKADGLVDGASMTSDQVRLQAKKVDPNSVPKKVLRKVPPEGLHDMAKKAADDIGKPGPPGETAARRSRIRKIADAVTFQANRIRASKGQIGKGLLLALGVVYGMAMMGAFGDPAADDANAAAADGADDVDDTGDVDDDVNVDTGSGDEPVDGPVAVDDNADADDGGDEDEDEGEGEGEGGDGGDDGNSWDPKWLWIVLAIVLLSAKRTESL